MMKKTLNIVLAVAAAAALIVSIVFGVQKAEMKKTGAELRQQLETAESARAELEKQLAETEAERAELENRLAETESAATAAQTALEGQAAELTAGKTALEAELAETEAERAGLSERLEKAERALTAERSNACLVYASGDWNVTSFGKMDSEDGRVRVTPASVTGDGEYTVGLTFQEPAAGLALGAVSIEGGEKAFPGAFIRINAIRVNGQGIPVGNGYTMSEDGESTRMYFYREWSGEEETARRCWDGNIAEAKSVIVDPETFGEVKSLEVDFSLMTEPVDEAAILFSNSDGSVRTAGTWGGENGNVTSETCEIRSEGRGYRAKVTFGEPVKDMSMLALAVRRGEINFPGYALGVTRMWVNGERVEGLAGMKGYTASDDGTETRMNLYNEGVDAVPENARSEDGSLEGAAAVWVNKADFAAVESIEIEFSYQPAPEAEEKTEAAPDAAAGTEEKTDGTAEAQGAEDAAAETEEKPAGTEEKTDGSPADSGEEKEAGQK